MKTNLRKIILLVISVMLLTILCGCMPDIDKITSSAMYRLSPDEQNQMLLRVEYDGKVYKMLPEPITDLRAFRTSDKELFICPDNYPLLLAYNNSDPYLLSDDGIFIFLKYYPEPSPVYVREDVYDAVWQDIQSGVSKDNLFVRINRYDGEKQTEVRETDITVFERIYQNAAETNNWPPITEDYNLYESSPAGYLAKPVYQIILFSKEDAKTYGYSEDEWGYYIMKYPEEGEAEMNYRKVSDADKEYLKKYAK